MNSYEPRTLSRKEIQKREDHFTLELEENWMYACVVDLVTRDKHDFVLRFNEKDGMSWFKATEDGNYVETRVFTDPFEPRDDDAWENAMDEAQSELILAVDTLLRYAIYATWYQTDLKNPSPVRKASEFRSQPEQDEMKRQLFGTASDIL